MSHTNHGFEDDNDSTVYRPLDHRSFEDVLYEGYVTPPPPYLSSPPSASSSVTHLHHLSSNQHYSNSNSGSVNTNLPTGFSTPTSAKSHNVISSEYTPLLEDFTEKFITKSQLLQSTSQTPLMGHSQRISSVANVPRRQESLPVPLPPNASASAPIPPELLYLYQQNQPPFNPNLVSTVSESTESLSSSYIESIAGDQGVEPEVRPQCCPALRLRLSQFFWYLTHLILVVSIASFNLGMSLTPQIYSTFFTMFTNRTGSGRLIEENEPEHEAEVSHSFLIDLLSMTGVQVIMSIIATISSLILLYATTRLVTRLRKRTHLSSKYRINFGPSQPKMESLTIMIYERLVQETLGPFFSRILALVMIIYQFALCSIYIHLLYDYVDQFLSSFPWEQISTMFCESRWYLNHQILTSIFLIILLVLLLSFTSLWIDSSDARTVSVVKLYTLHVLKRLTMLTGLLSLSYMAFYLAYHYYRKLDEVKLLQQDIVRGYTMNRLFCVSTSGSFNWDCLSKNNWLLLLSSVPLLLMPFHLNELLIMLLFSNYDRKYYEEMLRVPLAPNRNSRTLYQTLEVDNDSIIEPSTDDVPLLVPTSGPSPPPLYYLASMQSIKPYRTSGFFYKSYGTIRNFYLLAALLICLLNIIANIFFFVTTYEPDAERTSSTNGTTLPVIELNFLPAIFRLDGEESENLFLFLASGALLLKTSCLYLLLLFRGMMSIDFLGGGSRWGVGPVRPAPHTVSGFHFMAPFLIWNCLALFTAILLQCLPRLLPVTMWLLGLLTILTTLLYPALLLVYFAAQTLKRRARGVNQPQPLVGLYFKPLRWPKLFLLLALVLLATSVGYVILWFYSYFYAEPEVSLAEPEMDSMLSFVGLIQHRTGSEAFCPSSNRSSFKMYWF